MCVQNGITYGDVIYSSISISLPAFDRDERVVSRLDYVSVPGVELMVSNLRKKFSSTFYETRLSAGQEILCLSQNQTLICSRNSPPFTKPNSQLVKKFSNF